MGELNDRVCPECGGDRYRARHAQRDLEAAQRHRATASGIAKENGLLRYELQVAKDETRQIQSLLQRKILRQARTLRRLEEKLRKLGEKPYEGASLEETAPGAEYEEGVPTGPAPARPLIVP